MPGRMTSPVLVGRVDERTRLREVLDLARGGRSALVLVGGDAGVGKSRLVDAFLRDADDVTLLVGGCVELGDAAVAFLPVVEALRRLVDEVGPVRARELLGGPRRDLRRLVVELDQDRPDAETTRQVRLFEAMLSLLRELGLERPVVLVVEDLHWADTSTLDLIRYLARNLVDVPAVLIATFRTDELHRRHRLRPLLGELARLQTVERLDLGPLTDGEVVEQLTSILGRSVDPRLGAAVVDRADGNPFFVEELLAAWLVAEDDAGDRVPPHLKDILHGRLAPLGEAARRVLRVAAAAGRQVDHRLLERVADLAPEDLEAGLREAVAEQVLVTPPDRPRLIAFRHALLQEAVHDDLLPGERRQLHERFAAALADDPELAIAGERSVHAELAYHYHAAHDLERSYLASLAAAQRTRHMYAFAEEHQHLERALELWPCVGDDVRAGTPPHHLLLRDAALAAEQAGEVTRARTYLDQALEEAEAARVSAEERAGLLVALSALLWRAGLGDEALKVGERAVTEVPDAPSRERARALAWYGRQLSLLSRFGEAIEHSREAVTVARAVGARREESIALNSLGLGIASTGALEEGLEHLRTSLGIAKEERVAAEVLRAYVNLNAVLTAYAHHDEAEAVAREGLAWVRHNGIAGPLPAFLHLNLVQTLYHAGRWDEAVRELDQVDVVRDHSVTAVHGLLNAGLVRLGRGDLETARDLLDEAGRRVERMGDQQFLFPIAAGLAELAYHDGRLEEARDVLDRALAVPQPAAWWIDPLVTLSARVDADLAVRARRAGDDASIGAIRAHADRVVAIAEDALADLEAAVRPVTAALRIAAAERTRLDGVADPEVWCRAVAAARRTSSPGSVPYAGMRWAEALLDHDRREDARRALTQAHAEATRLGAVVQRDRIEALARRARLDLPGVASANGDEAPFGLTARELEVLALVAEGFTNREIGERLYITQKTASVHVSNILAKLEVSNRGEAAAVAHRVGLTGASD